MPFEGSSIARSVSAEYIAAQRTRSRSTSNNASASYARPGGVAGAGAGGGGGGGAAEGGIASPSSAVPAATTYDTSSPPQLFIVPSPVWGIPRNDDILAAAAARRNRSPSVTGGAAGAAGAAAGAGNVSNNGNNNGGPSSPRRSASGGLFGRRTVTPVAVASNNSGPTTAPIPEEDHSAPPTAAAAATAAALSTGSRSSDSERTLDDTNNHHRERDLERGEGEPVVGEPKYVKGTTRDEVKEQREKKEQDNSARDEDDDDETRASNDEEAMPESERARREEEKDPFLVTLEGRNHLNPHTWDPKYRWFLTGLGGLFVLNATFASSGPSQLIPSIITYFGVSSEVGTLTIALFVAGYCVGPLLWGPLSERYGRKWIFIIAFIPYTGFQVGCALSKNIGSLLVFRFLGGCFAASPLTTSGGLIADLWDADRRGIALAIFSLAPFAGPAIAPIVSGVLEVKGISWRWIFWILTIFAGVCLAIIVVLLPETYVPYLLHKEAKKLRKETGDDRWHSASENPGQKVSLKETLHHTVLKPFIMIIQEPMLLVTTIYLGLVYGVVYLLFEAIPIVFQQQHGWNPLQGGLVFLALPTGGALAVVMYALYWNKLYMKRHHEIKPRMVPPEIRLQPLMPASILFAMAFFIFAWTSYSRLVPVGPVIAIFILGWCILLQFLSIFNYLIDTYLMNAASALAINTVVRSAFGAGFPLFASQMYARLTTPGASSLLGGLAIVFIPAPFVLYKYGRKVREMSKNAMVFD